MSPILGERARMIDVDKLARLADLVFGRLFATVLHVKRWTR